MNRNIAYIICFLLIVAALLVSCSSNEEKLADNDRSVAVINWLEWDEWSEKETLKDGKKGLIWIHSPTCDECIDMENTTFTHPIIRDNITKYFHAIKLDVHSKKNILSKGKTWKHVPAWNKGGEGYHELAAALVGKADGDEMSYPVVVFLDENFDRIIPISKKLNAKELEILLAFTIENKYKTTTIFEFKKEFEPKIKQ